VQLECLEEVPIADGAKRRGRSGLPAAFQVPKDAERCRRLSGAVEEVTALHMSLQGNQAG
jgi:hypothetical protein